MPTEDVIELNRMKDPKHEADAQTGAARETEKPDPATQAPNASGTETSAGQMELPSDLPAAYQTLLGEKQSLYDRLLRKQAELENVRKRVQREKEEFLQYATADLIRALLPALDGLERALQHRDPNVPERFYEGIELIYRQLMETLRRAGLSPIETAGKLFDPHVHQAVETVEAPDHRAHEIVEEVQRGYKLKHRLLRPAIVKVAAGSRKEGSEPQSKQTAPVE